jgi:hypothetical protein
MNVGRLLRARPSRLALVLAIGVVAVLVVAAPFAVACTYYTLTSGIPQAVPSTPMFCRFTQGAPYWAGVAVRPQGSSDWDLVVYQNAAGEPDCVASPLAPSTFGGNAVDFVVGDFNHNASNMYYPKVYRYLGGEGAAVQWDDGTDQLTVDAAPISRNLESSQIIEVWDVLLAGGQQYSFHFDHSASTDFKTFLFQNPGGTYWAGRGSAIISSGGCFSITPSVTDYYGVVVINEGGVSGTYTLGVSSGLCVCPLELVSGTPGTVGAPETDYSFGQYQNYWTAVGVRGAPGADYDLAVYSKATGGTYPVCFSDLVQQSQMGSATVDFVVGDFNSNPMGTHFARAYLSVGSGLGKLEWDDGYDQLIVNDAWTFRSTGPEDVLEVWDVLLEAGKTYGFVVRPGASEPMNLYLFRNPSGGVYWANPGAAVLLTTSFGIYTAPATGYYGVVVVNQDGTEGMYGVRILTCEPIQPLASGAPVLLAGGQGFYSFSQTVGFWSAVGHRHPTEDFDTFVYGSASGPPWNGCFADLKAGSVLQEIPDVDYVVGDFNHVAVGMYYVWVSQFSRNATLGGATVEWDSGNDYMYVGVPQHRSTGANDVLECWDVYLEGGKTYSVYLDPSAGVNARAELFQNQAGSGWMSRAASVYSGAGHGSYVAPVNDYYGLVVVNLNGGTGTYDIGMYEAGAGVDESPSPLASGIEAIVPNPARGALRLDYALDARAAARFEALDMAGRIVWRQDEGERDAGRWSLEWRGLDSGGRRLPPGLYFVRMTVGGRTVALRKATLLE